MSILFPFFVHSFLLEIDEQVLYYEILDPISTMHWPLTRNKKDKCDALMFSLLLCEYERQRCQAYMGVHIFILDWVASMRIGICTTNDSRNILWGKQHLIANFSNRLRIIFKLHARNYDWCKNLRFSVMYSFFVFKSSIAIFKMGEIDSWVLILWPMYLKFWFCICSYYSALSEMRQYILRAFSNLN